jgi:hypothetical protein
MLQSQKKKKKKKKMIFFFFFFFRTDHIRVGLQRGGLRMTENLGTRHDNTASLLASNKPPNTLALGNACLRKHSAALEAVDAELLNRDRFM